MKIKATDETLEKLNSEKDKKDKWIAGLRSGRYTQTTYEMATAGIENSACCLHVLECEVNPTVKWEDGIGKYLPNNIAYDPVQFGGTPAQYLQFTPNYFTSELNDNLRLTFNQIADLLEGEEIEI